MLEAVRDVRHLRAICDATAEKLMSDYTDQGGEPANMIAVAEGTVEPASIRAVLAVQTALRRVSEAAATELEQLLAGAATSPLVVEIELLGDQDRDDDEPPDWSARAVPKSSDRKGELKA